ncbi:glycosyltransferase family 9 protein [Allosalinactinospora lopnorensis]|uniref:glycosyltransferase family 9 protein n=1 Tax=Allosalinactinospora lopnorensis TaxID=1352348 RepID=UPI000623C09A|nr:glycosyltransferase family 9 protein [Allosalinactinospora lopnorensis]
MDNAGDVLLAGPAVRAVARTDEVALLVGPNGPAAAELLPGVRTIIEWCAPWIDPDPPRTSPEHVDRLVRAVGGVAPRAALILTSFHQSPLPLALVLRLAGVPWIGAISEDYPGSLLNLRHRIDRGGTGEIPEPERMLSLAQAAGWRLRPGDTGALGLRRPLPDSAAAPHLAALTGPPGYVVLHPGASVPSRALPVQRCVETVAELAKAGHRVVVTGTPAERRLTAEVAGGTAVDLGGRTTLGQLALVLDRASAVIVGNTGPAHLAAAAGTPVVSLFSPVVPAARWAPYGVPSVLLGDQDAACRGTRARECPVPGHPCLASVDANRIVAAVTRLMEAVA